MSQTAFSKIASFCPEILRDPSTSKSAVAHTFKTYQQFDAVVNHADAQPFEISPAYVYLASNDSPYVTGQILHVNGRLIRYS